MDRFLDVLRRSPAIRQGPLVVGEVLAKRLRCSDTAPVEKIDPRELLPQLVGQGLQEPRERRVRPFVCDTERYEPFQFAAEFLRRPFVRERGEASELATMVAQLGVPGSRFLFRSTPLPIAGLKHTHNAPTFRFVVGLAANPVPTLRMTLKRSSG